MEAGPRDNGETTARDRGEGPEAVGVEARAGGPGDARGAALPGQAEPADAEPGGAEDAAAQDGSRADGADAAPVEPQELRPQRKLRLWQLAPIVGLGAIGSLMFAFPLAFEPGGGSGAVVAMLGLLICACAAGWGVMAARRVGQTWPGLPARGSGRRADWRVIALYAVVVGTLIALAIWRVARLR
ncbi:hypothetical protein [Streptomyces sp. ODS28]|uniref:hypothetical protein n=1 Tax=Streptomyces sp. ODS28 TaxID=3136688 RepID=UPI0031E63393